MKKLTIISLIFLISSLVSAEFRPELEPEQFLKRGDIIEIQKIEIPYQPFAGIKCAERGLTTIKKVVKLKPGTIVSILVRQVCGNEVWYRCHLNGSGTGWINSVYLISNHKVTGKDPFFQ